MNAHAEQSFQSIASFAKRRKVKKLKLLLLNTLHKSGRLILSNNFIAVEQSSVEMKMAAVAGAWRQFTGFCLSQLIRIKRIIFE